MLFAAAAVAACFALQRPAEQHRAARSYTTADAVRAFAAEGIALTTRERSPAVSTVGSRGDVLEVDAFAGRSPVGQAGFSDVTAARSCSSGARLAERWHGNLRVLVSCTAAGSDSVRWLRLVDRALARL